MQLTTEQKNIVESEDQHILVVANAGTGKTATITKKIHHLLNKNVLPHKMLVSSFSKVAAQELYEKIAKEVGQAKADQMFIGTLHALCYRIVVENLEKLNIKSMHIVGDSFITAIAFNRHADIFDKKKEASKYTAMYRKYLTDNLYPKEADEDKFNAIVEAQEIMESLGKFVFDDLIIKSIKLFETYPEVRKLWQDKYDYICNDESQDLNLIQWKLIKLLCNDKTRTITVGDAKQNVYSFRGCSFTYMDNWRKEVNAKVFTLTETFRFGKPFAELSNKVIDNLTIDPIYKNKTVTNIKCDNEPVFKCLGIESQTKDIVERLTAFLDSGFSYKDINVVYRYNKESIPFIKIFLKLQIPFEIKSGDVFERSEIKFIVLIMRLINSFNISDCIDFFSLYSDFVGDKTLTSIYKEIGEVSNIYEFADKASNTDVRGIGAVKKKSLTAMKVRLDQLHGYLIRSKGENSFLEIASIMEMEETKFMAKDRENEQNGQPPEDRKEFLSFFYENYKASDKKNVLDWYEDCLVNRHSVKGSEKNKVQLKTIHGCKGQSLPIVFLIANRICDTRFITEPEDIQNELFVMYVAVTRSEKHMYIYIDNVYDFKFNFILPDSMLQTNESTGEDNSLIIKLKENYSKQKHNYRNYLKEGCKIARSTDKAVMFSFNGKSFWTPISTVGFDKDRYFILDWVVKKNQFINYVEKY